MNDLPITNRQKIVTIVLTWNSADFIEQCLSSLLESDCATDILVIDNDSADNTRELIAKKFPKITLVNTGSNLGYAGGNNFGIKLAQKENPDYIFILNPDATVAPDAINLLLQRMEHEPNLAAVSPIIYNADTKTIWYAGSSINWNSGATPHEGYNQVDHGQFKEKNYTERANGGAMLVRASAIDKVGVMDENYFLYYEETDWSVRFVNAGYKIGLVPQAKVWHQASSSTGGHNSPTYQYYMTRNRLYLVRKFRPRRLASVFFLSTASVLEQLAITLFRSGYSEFWRSLTSYAKGYYDYLRGKFGRQSVSFS